MIQKLGAERVASLDDSVRPHIVEHAPEWVTVKLYSKGRKWFLEGLKNENIETFQFPEAWRDELEVELGDNVFRAPLMNAAGMFKDDLDDYYQLVADQGAGGFLAGTYTPMPGEGNTTWYGISTPFVPLPRSGSSINSLGLPNPGFLETEEAEQRRQELGYDKSAAGYIADIEPQEGVPVGVSIMGNPDNIGTDEYADEVIEGVKKVAQAGADFVEVNDSCPNKKGGIPQESGLRGRMYRVGRAAENHSIEAIFKLSNDTLPTQVEDIVDAAVDSGIHGVNFGNTADPEPGSEWYQEITDRIDETERSVFEAFRDKIGGGIGGRVLKERSLELAAEAAERVEERNPDYDFVVFRTGGVEGAEDILAMRERLEPGEYERVVHGWYTGNMSAFADEGHGVYSTTFDDLMAEV